VFRWSSRPICRSTSALVFLLCPGGEPTLETLQSFLDSRGKADVHCLLLLLSVARQAKDEGILAIRSGAKLDFQPVADNAPILLLDDLLLPVLKLCLWSPYQVASIRLPQPRKIVFTRHSAVHDPDPIGLAEPTLHRRHDLFNGGDVGTIAVENLVAEWHSLLRHDQRNAHLLAVRTVVAAVPPFCLRIRVGLPFEVRARHIIEQ